MELIRPKKRVNRGNKAEQNEMEETKLKQSEVPLAGDELAMLCDSIKAAVIVSPEGAQA